MKHYYWSKVSQSELPGWHHSCPVYIGLTFGYNYAQISLHCTDRFIMELGQGCFILCCQSGGFLFDPSPFSASRVQSSSSIDHFQLCQAVTWSLEGWKAEEKHVVRIISSETDKTLWTSLSLMVRKTAKIVTPPAFLRPPFVLVLIRLRLILSSCLVLLKVELLHLPILALPIWTERCPKWAQFKQH